MRNANIEVRPVAGALGAEVAGIDLSQPLDAQTVADIEAALYEHLVLFFRDQDITPAQHLEFAGQFGEILPYPLVEGLPDHPDIVPILKLEHETVNFGGVWHSDTAYLPAPPMAAVLVARELPPQGGDTLWSNMYLAYDALSDGMKRLLAGLVAVNDADKAEAATAREDRRRDAPRDDSGLATVSEHPVVRTHPVTGKKILYVNLAHSTRFRDMTEAESRPLLEYLFQVQHRPEFSCRLHWRRGTIAFWDNRATQHNPINDYHGYRRLMHRITIAGERPV
jgi:taurine dioxygenase